MSDDEIDSGRFILGKWNGPPAVFGNPSPLVDLKMKANSLLGDRSGELSLFLFPKNRLIKRDGGSEI